MTPGGAKSRRESAPAYVAAISVGSVLQGEVRRDSVLTTDVLPAAPSLESIRKDPTMDSIREEQVPQNLDDKFATMTVTAKEPENCKKPAEQNQRSRLKEQLRAVEENKLQPKDVENRKKEEDVSKFQPNPRQAPPPPPPPPRSEPSHDNVFPPNDISGGI